MAIDPNEDLDALEARLRRNLESIVADLLSVLRSDIDTFIERQVRNRFVADEQFAESMSDDALKELKHRIASLGETLSSDVCERLSGDMDFWFGPDVPQGEGKTFDAHVDLMERLQEVSRATEELLTDFGFPEDNGGGYQVRYAPPAYFVNGKYAPGLAESFWKYLAQLTEVRQSRNQQDAGARRAAQRRRWEEID